MFKNDFNGGGLCMLCEHCRTIIDRFPYTKEWEKVDSTRKGQGAGRGRRLDFCNVQCRVTYLRGRKYWQRKLNHIAANNGRKNSK